MLCCARDVCVLFRDMASVCVSEFWTFACCIVGSGKRRCHGKDGERDEDLRLEVERADGEPVVGEPFYASCT